ncbi:uncharacterized protein LOC123301481 [Chrysoperla carnea]|uniref:uncharacterized protein LOC123301481 n=1 Tax=Chrysoperla carnea TaxID=189513 RepID=UPI001D06C4D0|nr:uncharacterized protein LOC123301481 [Chrysoperla carnea]
MKLVLSLCFLISTVYASPFVQVSAGYDDIDTQIVKNGPYLYQIQRSPYGVSYSIQYNRPASEELYEEQQVDKRPYPYGHGLFGVPDYSSSSEEDQQFLPHLKLGLGATSSEDVKETTTKKSKSKAKVSKKPVSKFDKFKTTTEVPVDPITLINQIKDEYVLKQQQMLEEINDKVDALQTKAQTEYEALLSTDPAADTSALDTKYQQKYIDLKIKYDNKTDTMLTKYQSKIDALKTPDMPDQQFNLLDLSTFDIIQATTPSPVVPVNFGSLDFAPGDYNDAFQKSDYQTPLVHNLAFEHPSLRLGAVAAPAPAVEATTKPPTVADVYWKSFGAKIKETFNKTKTMTTDSTPVDATVIAADGSIVPAAPTTPLPATFYKTFGKTIGKSFKDATAKIMAVVKTTTVAPTAAVDDLSADGTLVTPAPTIDVAPAFWDDFGKQIEDVFKSKAVLDALKATTTAAPVTGDVVDPTLVNQQTIDLDYTPSFVPVEPSSPVTRKLKLGVGAVDDTVVPAAVPVPTVPGIYWKTFGDKIKESFNKSKTVTTDSTVSADGVTPVAPTLPPTFWMSFGKSIATALNNAKFKLISATKPTPGPLITDPTVATTAAPAVPIDAAFWDSFSKELDAALLAKAMLTTTAAPLIDTANLLDQQTTDDLQQLDDTADFSPSSKAKLYLAAGDDSTDTYADSPVLPPTPGAFWKNYGGQMAGYFINAKGQLIPSVVPPFAPMGPYAPVAPGVPMGPPASPGLYWKGYGDSMSGHFINAKGQILDTVSKIKPTFVPYVMPPFFGQTPYSTLNDDSQLTENVDPQETVSSFSTSSDEINTPIYKQHKLQLAVGSAEDDDSNANPGVYWQNFGQDIRDHFVDARQKIKNDVANAKFEQPIYTDDMTDPTSIPEKQTTFWTRFRQRIQDNLGKAKARMSEIAG